MKYIFAVVIVTTSMAFAQAKAETLHDDFQTLCAAPQADMAATLSAADAAGWTAVPTAGATPPKLPNGIVLKTFAVRTRSIAGTPAVLVSGDGLSPASAKSPSTDVKMCMVLSTKPDAASLTAEKADLQGEPFVVSAPASMYLVDRATGRASPLRGPPVSAGFKAGTLAMVMLIDSPQATGMAYQVPHPQP